MKKLYSLILTALLGCAVSTAQVTIGETNYTSLATAAAAAKSGDVIRVIEDITITDRVNLTTADNVTIEAEDGVTIYFRKRNNLAFLVQKAATFRNLTLVYNDGER